VIHPGDRVVVEEHTATVEARLEAIALEAAAIGSPVNARLKIGGKVVRAVAIAPGRAALAHAEEARP
jgi:flagella basal body P-ring formation protein FlgA